MKICWILYVNRTYADGLIRRLLGLLAELVLLLKDIEHRIEGFSYPIFFPFNGFFFLFSPSSLALDRIAFLATMP